MVSAYEGLLNASKPCSCQAKGRACFQHMTGSFGCGGAGKGSDISEA